MNKEGKISEIITDKYKLRMPPTVYYDLLEDVIEAEEEREHVLDKIRAEIEEHAKINQNLNTDRARALCWCLDVIDKYKAEIESKDE